MKIDYIKPVILIGLLVFVLTSLCGCSNSNETIDKSQKNIAGNSNNIKTNKIAENNSNTVRIKESQSSNTFIPNYISRRINLGAYSEIIRLSDSQRDSKKILFNESKMIFPEGKVVTITTKTSGTVERFLDITPEEVREFISMIEESKTKEEKLLKKNVNQTIGAEVTLILLNTSAEYIYVSIVASSDNNHWLRIYHENDTKEEITDLCIQSKELTEKIKELAGWQQISNKDLLKATKITCKDLYHHLNKEFELKEDEVKIVKTAISEAKPAVIESGCPFDLTFEATLDNGEIIHMLWADDSCGFIGIEGSAYRVSQSYTEQINAILTKKSPTPR